MEDPLSTEGTFTSELDAPFVGINAVGATKDCVEDGETTTGRTVATTGSTEIDVPDAEATSVSEAIGNANVTDEVL